MNDKRPDHPAGETPDAATVPPILDLRIEKLVTGGTGLARHEGQAVFVPLTAPGDDVRVEIVERKKGFLRASLTELVTPGAGRREAPCPHYGECGGCDLQHLDDTHQAAGKRDIVVDCFSRLGKLDVADLVEGPAPDAPLGYRNRIRLFASPAGFYGMMRRGTHDVVPLDACLLMPEAFNRDILPWLRFLPPVEQVVVRLDGQGGWLVSIFGQPARMKIMKKILAALPAGEPPAPGCVGLLYNNLPLWGRDHLVYEVAGHKYRVGAQSFFQGNLAATEDAVATVRAWLDEVATGDLFCDLFCGVGLFSLALADRFVQVIAVEVDRNACRDAANNFARAEAAGRRVALHEGPVTRILARDDLAAPEAWASATVLVDPPRAGLGRNGVKALLARRPRHLVYMSCDPATLARDTAGFAEGGYALRKLKVMDFFPQTAHIECLALLERTDP
ncbi:class I SAM-dependent RNA methyltransferase [bacterium]|nr:class I SAM-dependent RNA methyltransferase [bacterium]